MKTDTLAYMVHYSTSETNINLVLQECMVWQDSFALKVKEIIDDTLDIYCMPGGENRYTPAPWEVL